MDYRSYFASGRGIDRCKRVQRVQRVHKPESAELPLGHKPEAAETAVRLLIWGRPFRCTRMDGRL
jgi:hypothetical protein